MLPAPRSLTLWRWCELPVLLAKATAMSSLFPAGVLNWIHAVSICWLSHCLPFLMLQSGFLACSSTQTVLDHVTNDFNFFKNISPLSGLHPLSPTVSTELPRGSSQCWDQTMTPSARHPTPLHTTNPWLHVLSGVTIKALTMVQETVVSQVLLHPLFFDCISSGALCPSLLFLPHMNLSQSSLYPAQPSAQIFFPQTPAQLSYPC